MKNLLPETGCSRVGVIAIFLVLSCAVSARSSTRETAINTPADTKCVASEWKYFSYCGRINSVVRSAGLENWFDFRDRTNIHGLKITKDKDTSFVHPIARPSLGPLFDDPPEGTQPSFIRGAPPQGTIPYPFIYLF